jgi:glycosyltransferase involved in cell wall biosynthesis
MSEIWFWQTIVSPHMAGLASALARKGCKVTFVAEQELTADRVNLGWQSSHMDGVRLRFVPDGLAVNTLLQEAFGTTVHLCQGIRSNSRVLSIARRALARRGLCFWIVMETVNDAGVLGVIKRWDYARQFCSKGRCLEGILAIGHKTMDWIVERGVSANRIYPFAYFLSQVDIQNIPIRDGGPFRFMFVGQFIKRKRLDLLIRNLKNFLAREFELLVIGSGPKERRWCALAESCLPNRVRWLGRRFQDEMHALMAQADCLVLPSRFDGWGAVISEALMVGTPVICSDACGAAGAVRASGFGGVFARDRADELMARLDEQLKSGPVRMEDRLRLVSWASRLSSEAGADYLIRILVSTSTRGPPPAPLWQRAQS